MTGVKLEELKKKFPFHWREIMERYTESAYKATDGRPDFKWALMSAEKEFAKMYGDGEEPVV